MPPASSQNPLTTGRLLAAATIEVIPIKGAQELIQATPADATVAITCSPKFGLDRTLQFCAVAARSGRRVVPHLAARMVTSRGALTGFVSRIQDLGITDLYVIGGDGETQAGPYGEASQILEDLHERYLSKQHGMVGNVLRGRAYDPGPFVSAIAGTAGIEGLHFFSFNQVPEYVAWRDARRDSSDAPPQ